MKDFIVGRYREAKQKKKTWKKSNAAVCLYVFRGGVVTLCLHPNDLQVCEQSTVARSEKSIF